MNQNLSPLEKLKILVIDDHEIVLGGTIDAIKQKYAQAEIFTAQTAQTALERLQQDNFNLVVMDLSLPDKPGVTAKVDTGIQLLKTSLKNYPTLNIVVQSTYVRALVRVIPDIDAHKGGFTVADKSLSSKEMLTRVDWALQGLTYTKALKNLQTGLELKPEWLTVLILAFEEGLQDKAIAEKMNLSERMIRNYWHKVQDALGVYPGEGKNIRIQTQMRAREEGLID